MLKSLIKHHDPWALAAIGITFMLFVGALFIKGMKHDVLLETGVFLVSLKLIMMNLQAQCGSTGDLESPGQYLQNCPRPAAIAASFVLFRRL